MVGKGGNHVKCALCDNKECYKGKDCTGVGDEVMREYRSGELKTLRVSTDIESEFYMKKTRLEELIIYAKEMDFKRLGIAFCIGLEREAKIINGILSKYFEVCSVCCKICGIDKSTFDLKRLHGNWDKEAMCNPIGQARVLNEKETDLNVILGLCVGHDTLFTKYSKAPVTTLAVKDRVLGHNPLAVIYSDYYLKERFSVR